MFHSNLHPYAAFEFFITNVEFTNVEFILLATLSAAFVYQLYFYCRYLNGIWRQKKKNKKNETIFSNSHPPVSVIICAKNEEENLKKYLPVILEQDYPQYEVIVIDDASDDNTALLLSAFCEKYPHLYTTFVPHETKNFSTKKLGLTLGIKAAKHDILLLTDADCVPESKTWIGKMARNFTPGTDIVLGYGAYINHKGFLNKQITYETLFIAMQYMGMAAARKAYMGVGRNLAYRKETFKKKNGFVPFMAIRSGDDDLFVNHAADKRNVKIEVSSESITRSEAKENYRSWRYQKERHLSASPYYKQSTKIRLMIEPFFRALFYLFLILSLTFGHNWMVKAAATFLFLVRWGVQMLIINRTSTHFGERKYYFSLIFFDIFQPLNTFFILLYSKFRPKNIIWK
ncbi:MAG: glycosyltransferase [Prevotellaceae bacterium]|jgi:cellulose synthase/poly-beta-1,6-N-acetylglucosamine synthase-like glycosyltransferase|nr:glycosyltransferase [Prevotellaceae bacterium]